MKCIFCLQKISKSAWHTCPQLCHGIRPDWKLPLHPGAGSSFLCVLGACTGHLGSLATLLSPLAACVAIPARAKVPKLSLLPEVKVHPACATHPVLSLEVPRCPWNRSFLPFNAWINFFRLLWQYHGAFEVQSFFPSLSWRPFCLISNFRTNHGFNTCHLAFQHQL